MIDLKSLFLVENGLSFNDDVAVLSGSIDPSLVGQAAVVGSLFIASTGYLYQKFGVNDVDWQVISSTGTSVKVTSTDATTGYLNDKLTVASSLLKSVVPSSPGPQTLELDLSPTGVASGTYTKLTVDAKGRVVVASNPTTLLGYGITDAQPLHPNLTALANISAGSPPVGLYTITGTGASVARAITGTSNQIIITRGDGIGGNPQVTIADNAIFPGTAGITVPIGNQSQEAASVDGTVRYDSTLSKFRFRQDGEWLNFGQGLELYSENPVSPATSIATGQNAVTIGEGGIATGQNSVVLGTSTAEAPQSTAIGNGARSTSYGQVSFSARPIASPGSSQGAEYVYAGQTIAQFPIELFLDGVSARATFPDPDTAVTFTALIIAQRVDVKGEMYSAKIDGQLYKGLDNADTTVTTVKSQWGVTHQDMDSMILADIVNGTFNVKVKGKAGQTWRWTVRVSTAENIL